MSLATKENHVDWVQAIVRETWSSVSKTETHYTVFSCEKKERGKQRKMVQLLLIGDSDIALWPSELLPNVAALNGNDQSLPPSTIVKGYSGATLQEVTSQLQDCLSSLAGSIAETKEEILVIACAGENDIGSGIPLEASLNFLERFLDILFRRMVSKLIFLGPKFEPWLDNDPSFKKKYSKMSRSLERCCHRHQHSDRIQYINCLTMFCGESAGLAGATLAGKACADDNYFAPDGLHLSSKGYRIWKNIIEECIQYPRIPK